SVVFAICDEGDECIFTLHVNRNLTDDILIESRMLKRDIQFIDYINDSTDAILIFDRSLRLQMMNVAARKLFGISSESRESVGRPLTAIIPFAKEHDLAKQLKRVADRGEHYRNDDVHFVHNRRMLYLSVRGFRILQGVGVSITDITPLKRTQSDLNETRSMLQLVLDTIPSRVFWKDKDSRYIGGNRAVLKDAGLHDSRELIGRSDWDMPWSEQAELFRADDREVMQTREPKYNIEETLTDAEGDLHWLRTHKIPLIDSFGTLKGVLGTWEDVTAQKTAERDLRRSEMQFRSIFESSNDGIMIMQDCRIITANPSFCNMFEIKLNDIRKNQPHLADIQNDLTDIDLETRFKKRKLPERLELDAVTFQGNPLQVEIAFSRMEYRDRESVLGIVRDVRERKEMENVRSWMNHSMESSPIAIMLANTEGDVWWLNERAHEFFEIPRGKTTPVSVFKLFDYERLEPEQQHRLHEVFRGERDSWKGVLNAFTPEEQSISMFAVITTVLDDTGTFLGYVIQALNRREIEELRLTNVKLENEISRQYHLTQIGLLASGITHNLRNPLHLITMQSSQALFKIENLYEQTDDPQVAELKQTLEKISSYAMKVNEIIDDLMNYHRLNTRRDVVTCELNDVLNHDVPILKADLDIKHTISLETNFADEPLHAAIKPGDVSQIFLNLVSNARDAMLDSDNRVLTISTGADENGETCWFEVKDTGSGIPPEVVKRIGEPFFTTKGDDDAARTKGSGTGLGVYMIKQLLRQHHGQLEIQSRPGDTRFRVRLPVASPEDLPADTE
ncbi:PAS domain S-box protein, partial [bacterium]|nr:PAS domain S-box protein [bacterium]